MPRLFLCNASDLEDNQSKGFSVNGGDGVQTIFVVRRDNQFFAYLNQCPHTGVSLNWQDDVFLDLENYFIQCSVHGARFRVEDGLCVWGPCVNQSLKAVMLDVDDSKLHVDSSAL